MQQKSTQMEQCGVWSHTQWPHLQGFVLQCNTPQNGLGMLPEKTIFAKMLALIFLLMISLQ